MERIVASSMKRKIITLEERDGVWQMPVAPSTRDAVLDGLGGLVRLFIGWMFVVASGQTDGLEAAMLTVAALVAFGWLETARARAVVFACLLAAASPRASSGR
jgi:hypothetical protein